MNNEELILDHYKNPRNYGNPEWSPTHKSKVENAMCGDEIEVFLNVQNDKVVDIRFTARGCSISIASMSLLSDNLKGKSIDEIKHISEVVPKELLGSEISESRLKCVTLGLEAVKSSLLS